MRSVMDGGGAGMVWYGRAVCDDGGFRLKCIWIAFRRRSLIFNITEVFVLFLSDENV